MIRFLRSSKGMSLLEVIIALAVLGISVGAATTFFGDSFLDQGNKQIVATRDRVAAFVHKEIINPDVLAFSANFAYGTFAGNTAMADCLNPSRLCTVTRPGTQLSFHLVRQQLNGLITSSEQIAGSTAMPQFYDRNGRPATCTPGRACPFSVTASFWASCPVPSSTPNAAAPVSCNRPEAINVRFQVSQSYNPDFLGLSSRAAGSLRFSSIPPGVPGQTPNLFVDNPGQFAYTIAAKDIILRAADSCKDRDPNATQSGVDNDGRITCVCTTLENPGSRATDPLGLNRPTCAGKTCTSPEVMVGMKVNTSTGASEPDCQRPRECCWRQPFADAGADNRKGGQGPGYSSGVDCGTAGRLVKMEYGYCEVGRRKKDHQDSFSYCAGSETICCRDVMFFDASPTTITNCSALP